MAVEGEGGLWKTNLELEVYEQPEKGWGVWPGPTLRGKLSSGLAAWLIWGLGALFYLSGFYLRVAPAVMTSELMADFAVGAAGLGNLSAFYYYTYVGMQLPTGVLADLWGPRKLLASGALVAGLGTLLFAGPRTWFGPVWGGR